MVNILIQRLKKPSGSAHMITFTEQIIHLKNWKKSLMVTCELSSAY